MNLTWQDLGAFVVVALAVLFLLNRFVFASRRKAKKPDVPVSQLVRKKDKSKSKSKSS